MGINASGNPADASSMLDVSSTSKGVLVSRMTTVQRDAIANPAEGLLIFNTDSKCFNVFKNPGWFEICGTCAAPSSAFTPAPASGSINSPIAFQAATSGATYSWTFPSGTPATSTQQSPSVTWSAGGTYTVSLTVTLNGCSSTTTSTVSITGCNPGSQTFAYTGGVQTFTVPNCVSSIQVDVIGAKGGGPFGGSGGRAQATIPVTPGETLNIYVGGTPTVQSGPTSGGWNGGGNLLALPCGGGSDGWPGGGASDIRRGSTLPNRLIVAGGGGGTGWSSGLGGNGGGTSGTDGAASWVPGTHGQGGTSSAGGAGGYYSSNGQSAPSGTLGVGGDGGPTSGYCIGGGGGGGYYGGGGGYVSAGGGGSSYTNYPGNTNQSTSAGYNTSGNGQIIISW